MDRYHSTGTPHRVRYPGIDVHPPTIPYTMNSLIGVMPPHTSVTGIFFREGTNGA